MTLVKVTGVLLVYAQLRQCALPAFFIHLQLRRQQHDSELCTIFQDHAMELAHCLLRQLNCSLKQPLGAPLEQANFVKVVT